MLRLLLTMAASAAALMSLAPAAPVPDGSKKPALYFPVAKGTRWVYERDGEESVRLVTKVENRGAGKVVSIDAFCKGVKVNTERLLVSEQGLFRLYEDEKDQEARACLLRLPHKPAERWTVKTPLGLDTHESRYTALEVGTVEVPAGKFEVLRVRSTYDVGYAAGTVVDSYAPDVGVVKAVETRKDGDVVTVLKKFSAGKD